MSFTGTVEGGVVKLPPEANLPEGTTVRIQRLEVRRDRNELTRRLWEIAAQLDGLPEDWAAQHNHYIHSTPK